MAVETVLRQLLRHKLECTGQIGSPLFGAGMLVPEQQRKSQQPMAAAEKMGLAVILPLVAEMKPYPLRDMKKLFLHPLAFRCRQPWMDPIIAEAQSEQTLTSLSVDQHRFIITRCSEA